MRVDVLKIVDNLQKNNEYNYIDFLPVKMESPRYFRLEEYLLQNYVYDYAKKISNIIIKLIHYYPARIYISKEINSDDDFYRGLTNKNLRNKPLLRIEQIISHVIVNNNSTVQIIFDTINVFVICINGHFSVDIFNATNEQIELIEMLVTQEQLYLKNTENTIEKS